MWKQKHCSRESHAGTFKPYSNGTSRYKQGAILSYMFGKFQSAKWVGCMITGSLTGVRDLCCSICSSPKNMHPKNEKFTVRDMVAGQSK